MQIQLLHLFHRQECIDLLPFSTLGSSIEIDYYDSSLLVSKPAYLSSLLLTKGNHKHQGDYIWAGEIHLTARQQQREYSLFCISLLPSTNCVDLCRFCRVIFTFNLGQQLGRVKLQTLFSRLVSILFSTVSGLGPKKTLANSVVNVLENCFAWNRPFTSETGQPAKFLTC